jgi:hypothetical protein
VWRTLAIEHVYIRMYIRTILSNFSHWSFPELFECTRAKGWCRQPFSESLHEPWWVDDESICVALRCKKKTSTVIPDTSHSCTRTKFIYDRGKHRGLTYLIWRHVRFWF